MDGSYSDSQPGPSSHRTNGGRNAHTANASVTTSPNTLQTAPLAQQHSTAVQKKARKIERACDNCRQKRCRCDGPQRADSICTNCRDQKKSCTYVAGSKPRGPPKAYVTGLEDKLEQLEAILRNLRPNTDYTAELGPPIIRGSWQTPQAQQPSSAKKTRIKDQEYSPVIPPLNMAISEHSSPSPISTFPPYPLKSPSLARTASSVSMRSYLAPRGSRRSQSCRAGDSSSESYSDDASSSEGEDVPVLSLDSHERTLKLRPVESPEVDTHMRFHGKSSTMRMIEATRLLREEHITEEENSRGYPSAKRNKVSEPPASRRIEFWTTPVWELEWEGLTPGDTKVKDLLASTLIGFPPPDLAAELLDLYFVHLNPYYPLLHRPTFERQWREEKHKHDPWFTCLCLAIFAVTSRWSDDPRVCDQEDATKSGPNWSRAGWRYLGKCIEVHRARRSIIQPACLFELQTYSLVAMFFRGSLWSPVAWVIVSSGIRKAQDVGAHRQKVYSQIPTVDDELWKRAFFMLVALDRIGSAQLGRSCSIGEEDFDIEMPLEVDDEYWEMDDPATSFKQPPGKPSIVTAFVLFLKLTQISAFALRTIYAIDKSKVHFGGTASRWKEEVVSQLNSAMSTWVESIPVHLQWNEEMPFSPVFANQAALLYTTYYLIQIMVFRPFVPPPGVVTPGPSLSEVPFPFPALDICIKAAKTCARIVGNLLENGMSNIPSLIGVSHVCAAFMSMHVWDLKAQAKMEKVEQIRSKTVDEIGRLLADISVFTKALTWSATRWESAAHLIKALREFLPPLDDEPGEVSSDHQLPLSNYETSAVRSFHATSAFPPLPIPEILPTEVRPWPWHNDAEIESGPLLVQQYNDVAWSHAPGPFDASVHHIPLEYTSQDPLSIDNMPPQLLQRMSPDDGYRQRYHEPDPRELYSAAEFAIPHYHHQQMHSDVRSTLGAPGLRHAYRERLDDRGWTNWESQRGSQPAPYLGQAPTTNYTHVQHETHPQYAGHHRSQSYQHQQHH